MNNIDLLKSLEIFSQVSDEDLQSIAALLKERQVEKEEVVCRQGDPGDGLYLVQSGRIKSVNTDPVGRERVVGFSTDGQFFGEMALLTGEPWPTTMQAVGASRLLVLGKEEFDAFLARNIQLYLQMMKVIADRQAQAARVPRVDEPIPLPGITGGGRVFTVYSPKGGVGKSTIAVNLAVSLAHRFPESVALVDLSVTFGHDLLLLNMTANTSLAATTADSMKKMGMAEGLAHYLIVHERSSLRVVPGSTRPEEGEMLSGEAIKATIEQLRKYFSYVVIDTSCAFSDPVLAALESADRVLVLCTPEIVVLRDIRECQRIFNSVVHLGKDRLLYVMNNPLPYKGLAREQFEDALEHPMFADLPNGGDVPLKASLRGEAFVESQSGSAMAKAIQKLAEQLIADTAPKAGPGARQEKKRGLFGW